MISTNNYVFIYEYLNILNIFIKLFNYIKFDNYYLINIYFYCYFYLVESFHPIQELR